MLDLFPDRQSAVAVAGRSDDQLRLYAQGKASPSWEPLVRMALDRGVDLHWLATGEGEMYRQPHSYPHSVGLPLPEAPQPAPALEPRVHVLAITKVEQWLAATGRVMEPSRKAEAISLIYDMIVEAAQNPERAEGVDRKVERILRLVA